MPPRRPRLALGTRYRGVALLCVVTLVVGVLAAFHRGIPVADLDLNDGGVWVTDEADHLVAHLNYPARTLDGILTTPSGIRGLSQAGDTVVASTDAGYLPVATSTLTVGTPLVAKDGMTLAVGGDTALMVDAAGGRLWALDARTLSGFSADADPLVSDVKGMKVVVGVDGVGHVLAPNGKLRRIDRTDGTWTVTDDGSLADYTATSSVALTTAGDRLVAVDGSRRIVWTRDGRRALGSGDPVTVQQPGADRDTIALATARELLLVPLGDGDVTETAVSTPGTAAAPVLVAGCAYAAWSGSGAYLRDCAGTADDDSRTVESLQGTTVPVFRVNRDLVVLNETATGSVVLVNDDMRLVDNYEQLIAETKQQSRSDSQNTDANTHQNQKGNQSRTNRPPQAVDDRFGVRAGRSTTLPVLSNDSDPDGDVLTASVAKSPPLGPIRQVRGGEALQIDIPAGATGTADFPYTVKDGRGGEDVGQVSVMVHPAGENAAPQPLRGSDVTLARGAEARYNVLGDWIDPDGDTITLTAASAPAGFQVRTRPDGTLSIRDLGSAPAGRSVVRVVVSDGTLEATGDVVVHLDASGKNTPPVANTDHVRVLPGHTVVVDPIANDTDPEGDELRLVRVDKPAAGLSAVPDLASGAVTITAQKSAEPSTQYLTYAITDGPNVATSRIRVDVTASPKSAAPVADADIALLPSGGSVLVDVLANDDDPLGGVLVLQSAKVPTNSTLVAQVVGHGLLRISAPAGLSAQTTLTYTVSNGTGSADGQVTVVPIPPKANPEPPIALDDRAIVRAGDIVTVHVLANDSSPDGLDLTVADALDVTSGQDLGRAFVSQNTIRFKAGSRAGRVRLTYTVRDTRGNFASADVVLTVRALDAHNSPPAPQPLVARVLAGATVSIAVPLDGIDPDGDSVLLSGISRAAAKGTARVVGGQIDYSAPEGTSGTDTFAYAVTDRFGAQSSATVQVGIAPPPAVNQAPVAVADAVTARPGTALSIPVLANDFDGDGDPIALTPDGVRPISPATTTKAAVNGSRIELTTPADARTLQYYYAITDGRGGSARGVLTVTVTPKAPKKAPIARDDIVDPSAIAGASSVTVPVTDNDEDPDGTVARLTVSTPEAGVTVDAQRRLVIPVATSRQVIVYTVTDPDGLTASAVVVVPPAEGAPPTLRPDRIPVKMTAGSTVTLHLADYVVVRSGHTPRVTYEKTVQAGPGSDGSALVQDAQTLTFGAAGDFSGHTSITFEVTDGSRADDPNGLTAILTIPIDVAGKGNTPPTFHPSQVSAAAGEPATTVDLRAMVTDPDPGDVQRITFSLGAKPAGFTVSLDGSRLSVSAPADAQPNAGALLPIRLTDGSTKPVDGTIPLKVLASTRPLMTTTDATIDDGRAGQPRTVDIAAYVTNPFADQGKPITVVPFPRVAAGKGGVTASGTVLTITPDAGSHGQLTLIYRVADATNDLARQVEGRVLVSVRDKPDPPTGVTAETHTSKTASVSWTPGANNGAPITDFVVKWGSESRSCGVVTTCTITGLSNDVEYTFRVAAVNDVGESVDSDPSPSVRPDVKPDQPAPPSGTFGDGQVTVTWSAPSNEGSPITGYVLEASPPPAGGGQQQIPAGTLSTVWSGLQNGTAYRFRVQATNKQGTSDWSDYSVDVTPVGLPFAPTAPTVVMNGDKTLDPSATVSWAPADGNGDPALTYEVRRSGSSTLVYSGTGTSANVSLPVSSVDVTFEVHAINKAGPGPWSGPSTPVRPFKAPGAPSAVTATATGTDNQVQIGFTPGASNGALPGELTYQWRAGGASGAIPSGGGTVTDGAFRNGQDVAVTIVATATVEGDSAVSDPSTAAVANAYGPPGVPTVAATGNVNDVTLSWNGSGAGNGRPITAVDIVTSDGGQQRVSVTGSIAQGSGRNQTKTIRARAVDSEGHTGGWTGDAAGTTWESPFENTSHTGVFTPCGYANCQHVLVELFKWNPGSWVECDVAGSGASSWTQRRQVDGNGYAPPSGDGSPAPLFDSQGYRIPDGRNTVDCHQV